MASKPLIIVLLGRSGTGKGTQANLLSKKFDLLMISTGNLLRKLSKEKTPAGKLIHQTLKKGLFMPPWLASFLWIKEIVENKNSSLRIVFEGSPRKIDEAKDIDEVFDWYGVKNKILVLYIKITPKEAMRRLLLRGRHDDTPKAIISRQREFEKYVAPVIDYYRKTKRLIEINGEQSVEDVFKEILFKLKTKI